MAMALIPGTEPCGLCQLGTQKAALGKVAWILIGLLRHRPPLQERGQEKGASLGPFLVLEGAELGLAGAEGASC